jgi:hypothetical protein
MKGTVADRTMVNIDELARMSSSVESRIHGLEAIFK